MKPFNLYAAKAGAPVQTRGGAPAKIIYFERKPPSDPLVVLVTEDGIERIWGYSLEGTVFSPSSGARNSDLMMAPVTKTGWINVYPSDEWRGPVTGGKIYETEEEAILNGPAIQIQIQWEE